MTATTPTAGHDERLVAVGFGKRLLTRPDIGALLGAVAVFFAFGYFAREVNWLSIAPPAGARRADVKIRYRAAEAAATLRPQADGRVEVTFDAPQRAVTPGQAAVFYQGEVCLGGGWIESAIA